MKVALVHDWLVTFAGAERVLAEFVNLFPQSDVFSVVDFLDDRARDRIGGKHAKTTFIQQLPGAKTHYRSFLPLMPLAIEQLDLSGYDLVISSSHAVAKGVITGPHQVHISYVHSPIRYAWDMQYQYLRESGLDTGIKSWLARYLLHRLRMWDTRTANGVDHFVANSKFIARRVDKCYRRSAEVIYPPVDTERFEFSEVKEDYYLTASRLVPYKRVDLIVEAFSNMPNRKLVVVGDGPERAKVRKLAGPNVDLLGYQDDVRLQQLMKSAKAFVFAAEEDFGIVPVEAQACGTPVIAYGRGGALETVVARGASPTGVFFEEQTTSSIRTAVDLFEKESFRFRPEACRQNAETFSVARFRENFLSLIDKSMSSRQS